MKTSTCNNCGRVGHWAKDCRSKRQTVGSVHNQPGGFTLIAAIRNGESRSDFGVNNTHLNQSSGKLLQTWKTAPATAVGNSGNNRSAHADTPEDFVPSEADEVANAMLDLFAAEPGAIEAVEGCE